MKSRSLKYAKKWARLIFNHLHLTLAQWRIYHTAIIFRLNKNQEWLFLSRTGKEADCVCGTINPRESVGVSLFCLSSAAFCDSITDIVKKLRTLWVYSTKLIFLRGIGTANPEQARWANLALPGRQTEHRLGSIVPTGAASCIVTIVIYECDHRTAG